MCGLCSACVCLNMHVDQHVAHYHTCLHTMCVCYLQKLHYVSIFVSKGMIVRACPRSMCECALGTTSCVLTCVFNGHRVMINKNGHVRYTIDLTGY